VQFDRPIDHLRSTLAIMRESTLVETLTPLADSRPEVLFARAPTLPPGEYKLHWQVRTLDNVETVEGDFAFNVTH
jgi:methionine-rich copper-binding protein CopC